MAFSITHDQLVGIVPNAKAEDIEKYIEALNEVLPQFEVNTPLRAAHFIAQIAHESGSFRYESENLNYSDKALQAIFGKYFPTEEEAQAYARKPEKIANRVYANRMGNGNEASGDGWKYRGRGLIQLTGKDNYHRCGDALAIDLVNDPELVVADPSLTVKTACYYWDSRKLNQYADQDDLLIITKRINGGTHGLDDRAAFLNRAKQFLNIA
ncbi:MULTISPECIES: glycoside hydrolase family 19 protein [Pseudoalteromonas]|uniref:Glycoside hydrolase family 19 protein n=1 Tax=Pseudoalteromonas obscura TaxID=3048491 RepID=A0ABT7ESY6_9GAMM|nr:MULTISPECIES: glycoside hydrolase family 19 protein [Pseudoalteromonas]MBQ4839338.1 glycoside hydrolase family 19 protein [Pseudoalteromonas luteoviolacea]MDK2598179.1 glycoside hydrolase family 19 protein [Pseudoalteromonas sp. P94(2023)]